MDQIGVSFQRFVQRASRTDRWLWRSLLISAAVVGASVVGRHW